MTAFRSNLSGTAQLDDSLVLAFSTAFLIAVGQDDVMTQLANVKEEIGAKSIQISKYPRLALATTPLTETDEPNAVAMSDSQILLTPAEYGLAVTRTELASLQTGGKADLAAAQLVGINAGSTMNALATAALEVSGNAYIVGGKAAGSVLATDVADAAFLNTAYNKLSRLNVPKINGDYIMTAHDDVIHDLRANTAAGQWQDVNKYTQAETVLKNEVGMFKGFRIIRNNAHAFVDQTGTGTVDLYTSAFMGFNALGQATSRPMQIVVTGPFDNLARFLNVGWYAVTKFAIVDTDAVWCGQSASSVGANAS